MKKIKVLVVDDSPVFRALLAQLINADPDLEVIATAEDPYQARDLIKQHHPDVITLDIEMPRMNGVQFLKNLMRLHPMPVVMISTLTQHGAEATLTALELGAVDYFPKPSVENTAKMVNYKQQINDKIKIAAGANVNTDCVAEQTLASVTNQVNRSTELIAIGASTGGTEAVKQVLSALPVGLPPIVITQHISAMFSGSFANRLNANSDITVQEVTEDKVQLLEGHAYLAPGDKHLTIARRGLNLYALLDDRPTVNRHKPSVDVMFETAAEVVKDKVIGVILTGMGQDGAKGLLNLKQSGSYTIAQDQASSVVWGMPRVAVEMNAVASVVSILQIPHQICHYLSREG